MITYLKLFFTAMITFSALDFVWLNLIAQKFYAQNMQEVSSIQNGKIQITLWAGIIVYIFLALGIIHFVLPLFKAEEGFLKIFLMGAFFGLIVYGIYDMTNLATLKSWPLLLAIVDMSWGAFATGLVTWISFKVQSL